MACIMKPPKNLKDKVKSLLKRRVFWVASSAVLAIFGLNVDPDTLATVWTFVDTILSFI
jgi:hypothetical protein